MCLSVCGDWCHMKKGVCCLSFRVSYPCTKKRICLDLNRTRIPSFLLTFNFFDCFFQEFRFSVVCLNLFKFTEKCFIFLFAILHRYYDKYETLKDVAKAINTPHNTLQNWVYHSNNISPKLRVGASAGDVFISLGSIPYWQVLNESWHFFTIFIVFFFELFFQPRFFNERSK